MSSANQEIPRILWNTKDHCCTFYTIQLMHYSHFKTQFTTVHKQITNRQEHQTHTDFKTQFTTVHKQITNR